jgi:hypothetical protein
MWPQDSVESWGFLVGRTRAGCPTRQRNVTIAGSPPTRARNRDPLNLDHSAVLAVEGGVAAAAADSKRSSRDVKLDIAAEHPDRAPEQLPARVAEQLAGGAVGGDVEAALMPDQQSNLEPIGDLTKRRLLQHLLHPVVRLHPIDATTPAVKRNLLSGAHQGARSALGCTRNVAEQSPGRSGKLLG